MAVGGGCRPRRAVTGMGIDRHKIVEGHQNFNIPLCFTYVLITIPGTFHKIHTGTHLIDTMVGHATPDGLDFWRPFTVLS